MPTGQQSKLLLYLIMSLGLVLGFLYSSQSDPTAAVPALDNRFALSSLKALGSARIDDTVLTSDEFKALKVFGSLPVPTTGGGKDNPFQ